MIDNVTDGILRRVFVHMFSVWSHHSNMMFDH